MRGQNKFEVFMSKDGWRWRFVAENGEIVAQSEAYETQEGAAKGIYAIKTGAPGAATIYEDADDSIEIEED